MNSENAKVELVKILDELLSQNFVLYNTEAYSKLKEIQNDINDDFFTVVVLGEFKRGKSTFINALIGEDLLPTDVLPETATINALIYNDKPELQIVMQDGRNIEGHADRGFLSHYSVKNVEDFTNIKYLKIGYPFRFLEKNIVIVDTPGVSDLNEQRCDITYGFIPKANVVLFLLDANSPLKKSEYDFISERLLGQGIDNIIFIVNKYDNIDEEEDEDFWDNLQLHMIKAFSESENKLKSLEMYPLSAKMALKGVLDQNDSLIKASGLVEIKEVLNAIVGKGRVEEQKIRRYKARLNDVLWQLCSEIENKIALKTIDVDELREATSSLQDILEKKTQNRQQIERFVELEKRTIIAMTDKSLRYFYKKLEDKVLEDIQYYKGVDFKDYVEIRIAKVIKNEIENWLFSYVPNIDVIIRTVEKEIARGISYYFNQKIALNTQYNNRLSNGRYEINLVALDVSNSSVKAGAIAAGGAGLLMLMGGSVLMPFISMAAFPLLQRKFLQEKLSEAKEMIIPLMQEELANSMMHVKNTLYKYIDERCAILVANSDSAYSFILDNTKKEFDTELREKQNKVQSLNNSIMAYTNTLVTIKDILNRVQEV